MGPEFVITNLDEEAQVSWTQCEGVRLA